MRSGLALSLMASCITLGIQAGTAQAASSVKFPDKICDVTQYGAEGHRLQIALNTEAFQKAIDDCAAAGGGTVHVPRGNYLVDPLFLKSNIRLDLAKDATIVASTEVAAYRATEKLNMLKQKMAGFPLSVLPMRRMWRLPAKALSMGRVLSGGSAGVRIFVLRARKVGQIAPV